MNDSISTLYEVADQNETAVLDELRKKAGLVWECANCRYLNQPEHLNCEGCGAPAATCPSCDKPRPDALPGSTSLFRVGSICPHCGHLEPENEDTTYNVAVPVVELIEAASGQEAMEVLVARLRDAGFEVPDAPIEGPLPNAFESEPL